jgi:hypothetical protein
MGVEPSPPLSVAYAVGKTSTVIPHTVENDCCGKLILLLNLSGITEQGIINVSDSTGLIYSMPILIQRQTKIK